MPRVVTRYPSPLQDDTVFGTLGIVGFDEVHVRYEEAETWTSEEMDAIEQRLILPYMRRVSRCYLRCCKHSNWNEAGQSWYYGQYMNWRFGISFLEFEEWLKKMEDYHQKYSRKVEEEE